MLTRLMTASALALAITMGGVLAQTDEEEAAVTPPPEDALIVEQEPAQILSADLIGATVQHAEHGTIGSLDAVLFDEDNRIVGGVIAIGGFLGFGKKRVALSWDQFDVRAEEHAVYVDLTREQLDAAPRFKDRATLQAEREAEQAQRESEMQQQQPMPAQ